MSIPEKMLTTELNSLYGGYSLVIKNFSRRSKFLSCLQSQYIKVPRPIVKLHSDKDEKNDVDGRFSIDSSSDFFFK